MDAIELDIQTENTAAFIAAKPVSIVLIPSTRSRTPAGGYKLTDGAPRDPQTFRIIELGMQSSPPEIKVQDGTLRAVSFWLLGLPSAAVSNWDHWIDQATGRHWQVADVIRSNEYEVRAVVVEYGG
jgi:hypothetical protein